MVLRNKHEEAIKELMTLCYSIYGSKMPEINSERKKKDLIESWSKLLGDIPPEKIHEAGLKWAMSESWPPTPADIRKLALTPSLPTSHEQWIEVKKCYGDPEHYYELPYITKQAIRAVGGMNAIRTSKDDVGRTQFLNAYNEIKRKHEDRVVFEDAWDEVPNMSLNYSDSNTMTHSLLEEITVEALENNDPTTENPSTDMPNTVKPISDYPMTENQ